MDNSYDEPVFAQLSVKDYNKKIDNTSFENKDFYNDPSGFESNFMRFAKIANMYISCHFWDSKSPFIFTREDAKSDDFKISVVGDISCDIDGPVACTLKPSSIINPIYGYNPQTESEDDYKDQNSICVMAVDNLPCELPKDASSDFGREFIDKILPHLIDDKEGVIERATICKDGDLTPHHEFLRGYVNGEVTA